MVALAHLKGFMVEEDYNSVIKTMRLEDGHLFPIPIVLDVDEKFSQNLKSGDSIILRDKEGFQIARMMIDSLWKTKLYPRGKTHVWNS